MIGAQRPAARRRKTWSLTAWLRQHRASVSDVIADLCSNRGAVILSILVIGITLALPLGVYVIQENFLAVLSSLGTTPRASLFLKSTATREDAEALAASLRQDERFGMVAIVDKDEALSEVARFFDLDEVVATLAENPLPHTVVIEIAASRFDGEQGRHLRTELEQTTGVAEAQFDITWIRRLEAVADLAARGVAVFATILAFGVMLITGNTIRVGIHNRHDEIEVAKLCGATDAFVRRPFLYSGMLQGLFGAMVSCVIVAVAITLLGAPAARLASLYESDLQLVNISIISLVSMLSFGAALGWIGAWIAVTVYLRRIDVSRGD